MSKLDNRQQIIDLRYTKLCNFKNHLLPDTCEKLYYRLLFESHYQGLGTIIPYFWMPRYNDANDASARTLAVYNKFR